MAGKNTFAANTFAANTFASGCWTGVGTGTIEVGTTPDGLDYSDLYPLPHYADLYSLPHYSEGGPNEGVRSEAAEVDEDGFAEELEQGGFSILE